MNNRELLNVVAFAIASLLFAMMIYIGGTFVAFDPNPANWTVGLRLLVAIGVVYLVSREWARFNAE